MITRLDYLKDAENNKSQVLIRYKPKGRHASKRVISNVKVITFRRKNGYYITAYCHKVNADRTFKVSRIRSIDGNWFICEHLKNIGLAILDVLRVIGAIFVIMAPLLILFSITRCCN